MNKYSNFNLIGELETTITGKLLYLVLLDIIDNDNKVIIPHKRISKTLGISKSTVSKNLIRLRKRGYIDIIPQFNDLGGQMPNKYIVRD